jgi:hypothetical protein
VTVGPSHDNLQDIVQAIEFDAARHLHTPPDGRITAAQSDFEFVDRKSLRKPLFNRCDHRIIKTFRLLLSELFGRIISEIFGTSSRLIVSAPLGNDPSADHFLSLPMFPDEGSGVVNLVLCAVV